MKNRAIFLVGPTAVGKSEVAVELALKINAEIISCDSMQVYQGMEILTAAPDSRLRKKVPHHLISYIKPTSTYNVARFYRDVDKTVKQIFKKGKIPLFVGGSGLYYKVLLDGIFKESGFSKDIREKLYKEAKRHGIYLLYERLKSIDPLSADRIHPHDLKRIVRALEVYEKTGISISEWQKKAKGIFSEQTTQIFGLIRPKDILFKRIQERINQAFRKGLVNEVKDLLKLKLSPTASQAVGIEELKGYFENKYTLEEAKNRILINTFKLIKKQLTWFKKDKRIHWVNLEDSNNYKKIAGIILKKLLFS